MRLVLSRHRFFILFLCLLAIAFFGYRRLTTNPSINLVGDPTSYPDPQYIFVRKDPTCSNCYNWNGFDPEQINLDAVNEVYNTLGTKGTANRKVGIGVIYSYHLVPISNLKTSLSRLLEYARIHDFPVFIALDGFQWWDNRPDLWNWWDPNAPGYNVSNRNNVEWTCPNSSCAINKSWRNWGSEIEIKPHPNLGSSAFINANKSSLNELLPIIVDWYQRLPADKKWLLGGVAMGVEVDIGLNYYYYPNGTSNGQGVRGSVQLGYAAVDSLGIEGGVNTANLNRAIQLYLNQLNKVALDQGIPRNKIFNHTLASNLYPGAQFPPGGHIVTSDSALSSYAQPGWSIYHELTMFFPNIPSFTSTIEQLGNTEWASPEWMNYNTDKSSEISQGLRTTLGYRNNRLINIANWENVKSLPHVIDSIRAVANESPSCWVTSPHLSSISVSGNTATINWQNGVNNQATYLQLSTSDEYTYAGTFQGNLVANSDVTNQTNFIFNNNPGNYFLTLISDGCSNQRRIVYDRFTLGSSSTTLPGDLNGDSQVNLLDFNQLLSNFGNPYTLLDFNTILSNFDR
jgi:hypothetical protein